MAAKQENRSKALQNDISRVIGKSDDALAIARFFDAARVGCSHARAMKRVVLGGLALLSFGCGSRTVVRVSGCDGTPITCIQRSDACDAPRIVDAQCSAERRWVCPSGSRPHARAPTDDGQCLWLSEEVTHADGTIARNVAFEPDLDAPFGTCPTKSKSPPRSILKSEDPNVIVQVTGAYRLKNGTRIVYRLFRVDPKAVFGVTHIGGGLGRWQSDHIVIPPIASPSPWSLDEDFGDAMIAEDDAHALVWGCAKDATNFVEGCTLARFDDTDHFEILPRAQFSSGPWVSSVVKRSTYSHVFVPGFGTTLETDTAVDPQGPWSRGPTLARCALPNDPKAYCAGPVEHPEIEDPTTNERAISYSVGSTSTSAKREGARLVFLP